LVNTSFSPRTTFGHNLLSGFLLKMVKRTNLTVNDRQKLKGFLLERFENGRLGRGPITQDAVLVSITHGMVSRLWQQWNVAHANALNGEWDVASGKMEGVASRFFYVLAKIRRRQSVSQNN
jgi:hypothetical protein